jgi:hypothetical protein
MQRKFLLVNIQKIFHGILNIVGLTKKVNLLMTNSPATLEVYLSQDFSILAMK